MIEAVFEELDVKRQVFGELEEVVPAECVLATNTSALSVTAMAEGLEHPERLARHALLQPGGADAARRAHPDARDGRRLARDRVVGRGQAPQAAGARERRARLRRQPAPDADDDRRPRRDRARQLGRGGRRGGALSSGCRWRRRCSCRWSASRWRTTCARRCTAGLPGPVRDQRRDGPTRTVEEIRDAVLEALADEIRHLLEEGVVESPKDVDTALILGAGFPFFMGGLTPVPDASRLLVRTEPARPPRARPAVAGAREGLCFELRRSLGIPSAPSLNFWRHRGRSRRLHAGNDQAANSNACGRRTRRRSARAPRTGPASRFSTTARSPAEVLAPGNGAP